MVAIFILVGGQWKQHGDAMRVGTESDYIARELDYLRNMLGVTAKLFRKV